MHITKHVCVNTHHVTHTHGRDHLTHPHMALHVHHRMHRGTMSAHHMPMYDTMCPQEQSPCTRIRSQPAPPPAACSLCQRQVVVTQSRTEAAQNKQPLLVRYFHRFRTCRIITPTGSDKQVCLDKNRVRSEAEEQPHEVRWGPGGG